MHRNQVDHLPEFSDTEFAAEPIFSQLILLAKVPTLRICRVQYSAFWDIAPSLPPPMVRKTDKLGFLHVLIDLYITM